MRMVLLGECTNENAPAVADELLGLMSEAGHTGELIVTPSDERAGFVELWRVRPDASSAAA